jgi:hypothetical protein
LTSRLKELTPRSLSQVSPRHWYGETGPRKRRAGPTPRAPQLLRALQELDAEGKLTGAVKTDRRTVLERLGVGDKAWGYGLQTFGLAHRDFFTAKRACVRRP